MLPRKIPSIEDIEQSTKFKSNKKQEVNKNNNDEEIREDDNKNNNFIEIPISTKINKKQVVPLSQSDNNNLIQFPISSKINKKQVVAISQSDDDLNNNNNYFDDTDNIVNMKINPIHKRQNSFLNHKKKRSISISSSDESNADNSNSSYRSYSLEKKTNESLTRCLICNNIFPKAFTFKEKNNHMNKCIDIQTKKKENR